jgi:hypothetical protein
MSQPNLGQQRTVKGKVIERHALLLVNLVRDIIGRDSDVIKPVLGLV